MLIKCSLLEYMFTLPPIGAVSTEKSRKPAVEGGAKAESTLLGITEDHLAVHALLSKIQNEYRRQTSVRRLQQPLASHRFKTMGIFEKDDRNNPKSPEDSNRQEIVMSFFDPHAR